MADGTSTFCRLEVFRKLREDELDPTDLIFEESPAPAVELLNLTGRLPHT